MSWPTTGRAHRAGQPPTHAQVRVIFFVYQMNGGPVGDGCTRAEIKQHVPEISDEELADALRANWIKVDYWGIIGGGGAVGDLDCWDTLPDGVAFLRAEQAKRLPEHEHQWRETETKERFNPPWEACSVCGAYRTDGPGSPPCGPDLWHQLHEVYG